MPFVTHAGNTFLNNVENVLKGYDVESDFRGDEVSTSDYSMVDDNDDDGIYVAESDGDQLNADDSTKLVANGSVCTSSSINSPTCSEIQLIDELLIHEDELVLHEIDELYDELLDLTIS